MTNRQDSFAALEADPEYWRELALAEFLSDLGDRMKDQRLKRADLARRLETRPPYVSRVFRGEDNLTLLTLVKFAMAVGGVIHVHIADPNSATTWTDRPRLDRTMGELGTAPSSETRPDAARTVVRQSAGNLGAGDLIASSIGFDQPGA
jgi:hypothetical protein